MAERGEYRAIRRVLLDGPDFQRLPERARWVFVALKLNVGPTGIEVHYPGALEHQLSAQTGARVEDVSAAMGELEAAGWIRRESNVLWIVGQLTHDPHMDHRDAKHRTSVWRHLQGLPHVGLVGEFVRHHPEWFEAGEYIDRRGETKSIDAAPAPLKNHLRRAFEGPNKALQRPFEAPKTDNRRPITEDQDPPGGARDRARMDPPVDDEPLPEVPGDTGAKVVPIRPSAEHVPFGNLDWDGRTSGASVLREWIALQPTPPSTDDRNRFGRTCKMIADRYTVGEIALAFIGMRFLWPWAAPPLGKGEPWTPETLLRNMAKAIPAAANHPQFKAGRSEAEFHEALERAANGDAPW